MIPYPPVGPLWSSAEILGPQARPMILYPPVGPLWGSEIPARAEILRDTSGEHFGNTNLNRDPEGHVWGALKSQHHRREQ